MAGYDAFLSFTRKGHPDLARRVDRALGQAGMRVFFDERISEGDSISEEIIDALAQSKVLIVIYSRQYLHRNACQEELRRVFIAAEAEGDLSRRIVVVNPEEGNDHIAPAELRDARYVSARDADADLSGLICAVRDRIATLPGPMSSIRHTSQPRWLPPRIPGTPGFVGRDLVAQSLRMLDPDERIIVDLAGVLGSQPLPAQLIEAVLSAVAEPPADAGRALDRLEMLALARRDATSWYVHPLISDAARRAGPPPVSAETLTVAAARGILTLGATRLARTLAAAPALRGTEEAGLLWHLMAEHYESLGDVVQAARVRRLLAASRPGSVTELTAAALACNACGDFSDAADLAQRAINSQRTFLALWAAADALDGLGRYGEADALWRELDATDPPSLIPPAQRVAYEVSRARAYLARGQTRAASTCLEAIRRRNPAGNADDATVHQVNSATVQLAVLCLQTSREYEGRKLARSVVTFYRDRHAEKHATCLQAELAWAEAAVSLPLFELKTDKASWAEAASTLERLYDSYRDSAGAGSVLTLTIAVQRALILARVGKRNSESLAVVSEAVPEIEARLGRGHPLWLRCQYILGLLHLRENDFEGACRLLEAAWTGQKDVLGPLHPETLGTELEFGCVLRFFDAGRSRRLIAEVRQALPGVTGRKNFNYGRAFFASTLLPALPTPVLRRFWELSNRLDYKDPQH
jgi:tetratricopeptide (TPR) repeat protein